MKTSNLNKVKEGDILFRVDSQKLVIETTPIRKVKNGYGKVCICNSFPEEELISIDRFPIELRGLMIFRTKESAIDFIKTQIGL